MRFEFRPVDTWPPLAWLARCSKDREVVEVRHGQRVETATEFFCEAVWAGDFAAGDFDRTDVVFGSGARLREGVVTFVSAGSTVDRLQSFEDGRALWVSNSLVCLLAAVGAELEPTHSGYTRHFQSIVHGLGAYERELATSAGAVRLTYFNNLAWDGEQRVEVEKPESAGDFSSYEAYRGFLERSLYRIAENMAAAERRHSYSMLGTISSGYDSPAVAVLGRSCGLREVITFDRARGGDPDSGVEIARVLGLDVRAISSRDWRKRVLPEVPFLAVHGNAGDIWYAGAEDLLKGRVLLTGYHGDKVWAKSPGDASANIVRGDLSGLSVSEYRLWTGFVHVPVPFIGARRIRQVLAITNSVEMKPWDIPGDYSRPFCRRLIEEAGVPRELLAVEKRFGSVRLSDRAMFRSTQIAGDYTEWLKARSKLWRSKGRVPPRLIGGMTRPFQSIVAGSARVLSWITGLNPESHSILRRLHLLGVREHIYRYIFPWAVETAKRRYGDLEAALESSPETLRLCLATLRFFPVYGGPGERFRRYSPGLRARGVDMCVFTSLPPADDDADEVPAPSAGQLAASEDVDGISVHRVGLPYHEGRARTMSTYTKALARFCADPENRPAVVQFLALTPWSLRGLMRLRRMGIPSVYTRTMVPDPSISRVKRLFWSLPMRFVDCVVVSSGVMRDSIRHLFGLRGRIEVIPNGVDLERFSPLESPDERARLRRSLQLDPDSELIVFVGGVISERKGIDLLLSAWHRLCRDRPKACLVLVGPHRADLTLSGEGAQDSFIQTVKETIDSSPAPDRVIMTGRVERVEEYFQVADVFVFPSRREGMPNVVAEAFACGVPGILSPFVGLPEEFGRPGEEYVLVDHDSAKLAESIGELLDDPGRRERLGRAARRWVEEHLSVDVSLDRYVELYRELAERDRRPESRADVTSLRGAQP